VVVQTNSVLVYLGSKLNIDQPIYRIHNQQVLDQTMDLRNDVVGFCYGPAGNPFKPALEKHMGGSAATNLTKLEGFCVGPYMCGPTMQSGDFHVFEMLDQHLMMCTDEGVAFELNKYPKLAALHAKVKADPALAGYFASDQYAKFAVNNAMYANYNGKHFDGKFGGTLRYDVTFDEDPLALTKDKPPTNSKALMGALVPITVMQLIGLAIAFGVFKLGATAAYSERIAAAVDAQQHLICAALAVVAYAVRFVNFFPMAFKSVVMKGPLRDTIGLNMRSNQFVYSSVKGKDTVIFENDGVVGMYNRANRSLTHMTENFASVLAGLMMAGTVFPFPTLVCAVLFGLGRIWHQVGYSVAYGKHGGGFAISLLATLVIEGLLILVVLAAAGLLPTESPAPALPVEERIASLEATIKAMAAKSKDEL